MKDQGRNVKLQLVKADVRQGDAITWQMVWDKIPAEQREWVGQYFVLVMQNQHHACLFVCLTLFSSLTAQREG